MEEIHSTSNRVIKQISKLDKKKYRDEGKEYLIEGPHLVEEALKSKVEIIALFLTKSGYENSNTLTRNFPGKIYLLTEDVYKKISTVPTPQGVLALVKMPSQTKGASLKGGVLVLDNVQDPGNVGTMIRTADAAGYATVVLGKGCADIYNSKVLRSMQGSHFHLTIIQADLIEFLPKLKKKGTRLYGTELNSGAVDYRTLEKKENFALIMGNEGQGVSDEILELVDQKVYIPITGQAESLNVAVAAGILMFSI